MSTSYGVVSRILALALSATLAGCLKGALLVAGIVPTVAGTVIGAAIPDPEVTQTFNLDPSHPDRALPRGYLTIEATDGTSSNGYVGPASVDELTVYHSDGSTETLPLIRVRSLTKRSSGGNHLWAGLGIGLAASAASLIATLAVVFIAAGGFPRRGIYD
jgi:hypothetical protein